MWAAFLGGATKNSIGWLHVNVNFPTWKVSNVEFRLVFLNLQSRRWRTWNVALIGLRWGMVVCDQIMWVCYLISFETTIYQPRGEERGGNCDSFQLFWGLWVGEGGAGCFLSVLFFRMPPGLECVPPLLLHAGGSGGQFFNWSILVSEGKRIIVSDLFGRLFVVFETLTSRVNVIQHSHRRIGMAKEARQRLQLGS